MTSCRVNIRAFALGNYEVTQARCKAVRGTKPSHFVNCGNNCPVKHVNWDDIQQFVEKLTKKAGHPYRLPGKTEWEYAASAGTSSNYGWRDNIHKNYANCDGCGSQR